MKCPKCKGRMIYEAALFEGDQGSSRCLICGNHIWEPRKVVMPSASQVDAREMAQRLAEKRLQLLRELAELDPDYLQVSV